MKHEPLIAAYIEALKAYNEKINVFSKHAYDRLGFHVQDCMNLAALIGDKDLNVLDMGSGSGFPSVILAIVNSQNRVVAVESKRKKAQFLEQVQKELSLKNYLPVNQDVREYLAHVARRPDVVTAKAFASYQEILKILNRFKGRGVRLLVPISELQYLELKKISSNIFNLSYQDLGYYYVDQMV